jgi:hypothetical protein
MKKMMNVAGARQLSKNEQKNVVGGMASMNCGGCNPLIDCCVPNQDTACESLFPGCSYLYQSEWNQCCNQLNYNCSSRQPICA